MTFIIITDLLREVKPFLKQIPPRLWPVFTYFALCLNTGKKSATFFLLLKKPRFYAIFRKVYSNIFVNNPCRYGVFVLIYYRNL